jgi:hypothetical protein
MSHFHFSASRSVKRFRKSLADEIRILLKFFSERDAHKGIPDKHKRYKSKCNVLADLFFVAHGLIHHPETADIPEKYKTREKNDKMEILKQAWPDYAPKKEQHVDAHRNEPRQKEWSRRKVWPVIHIEFRLRGTQGRKLFH